MKRSSHISIGASMAFVILLALGLAALRTPTVLRAQAGYTLAIVTLSIAALWAYQSPGSHFARGFVLFGGVYFVVLFNEHFSNYSRSLSLTTPLLKESYNHLAAVRHWELLRDRHYVPGFSPANFGILPNPPEYVRFETIGHAIFTLVFGVFGGAAAVFFDRLKGRGQ